MRRFLKMLVYTVASAALVAIATAAPSQGAGGAFSASYSGAYLLHGRPSSFTVTFSGNGKASFLGASAESGKELIECPSPSRCTGSGSATLVSHFRPADSVMATLSCTETCGVWKWSLSGGTGKFAHATGSGKWTIRPHRPGGYTDQWTGTLNY
jgi:hypothetical protein